MGNLLLENIVLDDRNCDIHIKDNLVSGIYPAGEGGKHVQVSGNEAVDCAGKTVLPGLVNMHTHAAMTLLRGVGEDICFADWIDRIWVEEEKIDPEYIYWATKVACIEMLKTGTVAFLDQYWYPSAAVKAVAEMGMRAVLSYVHLDHHDKSRRLAQQEECRKIYEESLDWPSTMDFSVAIHSVYSVSREQMLWAADFARDRGLKINIHVSETRKEVEDCVRAHGMSPVKYLDSLGILGPDVIAAHALWLDEEDIAILAARKVTCVHNINSNLKLASGYRFLYDEMRDAGINLCLGTDGCASSNNLDLLEAMKTSAIVQKAWRNNPAAMPLDELLAMATSNAAAALGLDSGRIAPGCLADMIIIDTDSSFFLSNAPFLANLVYSAHSDCVDSVICDGKFVMRGRRTEDEREILAEARKILKRIR